MSHSCFCQYRHTMKTLQNMNITQFFLTLTAPDSEWSLSSVVEKVCGGSYSLWHLLPLRIKTFDRPLFYISLNWQFTNKWFVQVYNSHTYFPGSEICNRHFTARSTPFYHPAAHTFVDLQNRDVCITDFLAQWFKQQNKSFLSQPEMKIYLVLSLLSLVTQTQKSFWIDGNTLFDPI